MKFRLSFASGLALLLVALVGALVVLSMLAAADQSQPHVYHDIQAALAMVVMGIALVVVMGSLGLAIKQAIDNNTNTQMARNNNSTPQ